MKEIVAELVAFGESGNQGIRQSGNQGTRGPGWPKILVSDPLALAGLELLRQNADVEVRSKLPPAELIALIPPFEALIVRSETKVTRAVIEAGCNLRVIGRAGNGLDNVDVETAARHDIRVLNTPLASTITVAEHAIGLMLALARHVPAAHSSLLAGKWERSRFMGVQLAFKTLGVIGLGRIGREVARRAQGLAMKVVAFDPFIAKTTPEMINVPLVPFKTLLQTSDFITIHTPLAPATYHLIGEREFKLMKPTARLINCARGGIVDEAALLAALNEGRLAGAALDVFEHEPPGDSPLLGCDKVIATPHLGASTHEAQVTAAIDIAPQVLTALQETAATPGRGIGKSGNQGSA
jgi:D-3-phosphoglycerate dehydrogenase